MKLYEVLPAMEAGKKIRRRGHCPFSFFSDSDEITMSYASLKADDWEIVEDVHEVKLFRSKEIRFACPKCERESEILVYPEDRPENIHECRYCGQKIRFINLEEMKKVYYEETPNDLKIFEIRYKGTWICNIRCAEHEVNKSNIPHNFFMPDRFSDMRLIVWGPGTIEVNEIKKRDGAL